MESARQQTENYSRAEQIANVITHGAGIVFGVIGFVLLVIKAEKGGHALTLLSFMIYGLSLILMFTSSTLYHGIPGEKTKTILRKIDHSAIYLLIAGTYSPFLLITLNDRTGWTLFVIVWIIAIAGILYKTLKKIGPRWVSAITYILMGWLIVLAAGQIIAALPCSSLVLLVAGGLLYTGGTVFYIWKRLPFNHAIWHVFVLAAAVCHYFAVYYIFC